MNHKAAVLLFAQKDVTVQKQESMSERISNFFKHLIKHVTSRGFVGSLTLSPLAEMSPSFSLQPSLWWFVTGRDSQTASRLPTVTAKGGTITQHNLSCDWDNWTGKKSRSQSIRLTGRTQGVYKEFLPQRTPYSDSGYNIVYLE